MNKLKLNEMLMNLSESYYTGDIISGDSLLLQCEALFKTFYQGSSTKVIEAWRNIITARNNNDFVTVADTLRHELIPLVTS